ncbi:MAG: hypothetical protein GX330_06795 [Bacteroidales bacterium]|nr:hypothetical protein [Bacteroidales bacterium]
MTKRLFIIMVALSFLSCDREETSRVEILQIRKKAVDTLKIDSNTFVLDAYLWRDFMPVSPENGQSMISINWLICIDSTKIPDNINMVKQYVIYNDEVWEANYENEAPEPSLPEYKMVKISRNGPKWGPKVYVDVISQIRNSKTNKDYYIERKNVYIERTD